MRKKKRIFKNGENLAQKSQKTPEKLNFLKNKQKKGEMRMEEGEQAIVLENDKKNMLVSASAGCGKTHVMIEYIKNLVCKKRFSIEKILVLTFTKSAAQQMKDRLIHALQEVNKESERVDEFVLQQLDLVATSNIATIDSFCEKYVKKYANLLDVSSNFSVVDESETEQIHIAAVSSALKDLKETDEEAYVEIMSTYKSDRKKIEKIMKQLKSLLNAMPNGDEFLQEIFENCENLYEKAENFLMKNAKKVIFGSVSEIEELHLDDFASKISEKVDPILNASSLSEALPYLDSKAIPKTPRKDKIGENCAALAGAARAKITSIFQSLNAVSENLEEQKSGKLEKSLIKLFKIVQKEENSLKKAKNVLEFSDIEKYMTILSNHQNLFEGFEYVFVDEYQDTNKIQENFLKNVAKNCNFVAVGDVKQGIYGFRLASSQIFLNDAKNFEKDDDSQVCFLKENHRSDKRVLDFVNDIFSVCMTEESAGVDYVGTSMLKAASTFSDDGEKGIEIELVEKKEIESEQKPEIYSVMQAGTNTGNSKELLLNRIRAKIAHALGTSISDKNGKLRKVKYSDIVILSRERDEGFLQLETFLRESGVPVNANSRGHLMSVPQTQELLNFMKILLAFDDDIALLSVLTSPFFNFEIEQILSEKSPEKTLCQTVQENPFFAEFVEKIKKYRVFYQIFGLKKMFFEIFKETNYLSHINLYHPNLSPFIDKFLDCVQRFDFDLSGAISFFESVDVSVISESSPEDDCVLLTTIHDSKGMEWPIVILMNCDKDLFKAYKNDVEISEELGLCAKPYDKDSGRELKSVKMEACRQQMRAKDFSEALMIFYVALTRAETRLILIGEKKKEYASTLFACKNYFDFVFLARPDLKQAAQSGETFETATEIIRTVDAIEQEDFGEKQDLTLAERDDDAMRKIQDYLDFSYDFGEEMNYRLKESVTNLSNKNRESMLEKFNGSMFNFSDNLIEMGNAYHYALKNIDFAKISSLSDIEKSLSECKEKGVDVDLIDKEILLKNVLLLKEITADGEVFKEREFIMKVAPSQVFGGDFDEKILTQGIVDLFVIKDNHAVLVDYKFSQSQNDRYLVEKYIDQLKLYKIAISSSFSVDVSKVYLLSLKNAHLIEVKI